MDTNGQGNRRDYGPLATLRVTPLLYRRAALRHDAAACSFWFSAATRVATSGGASA